VKVLYLLLDLPPDRLLASLEGPLAALAGAWSCLDVVQLRAKDAPAGVFCGALARLRETVIREAGALPSLERSGLGLRRVRACGRPLVLANDRLDVALAAGADGLHLGSEDLPPEAVRESPLPPGFVLGLTCHTLDELSRAPSRGVDYAGVGTFYPSPTKPGLERDPRPALRALPADYPLPLFAIGGLTLERAPEVLSHPHVAGVVTSSAIQRAPDPVRAAREWRALLDALDPRP
jgi:thiamine-phosphate pyrophosphorylase